MKPKNPPLISDEITDQLLTIVQVAERCQCSERKVKQWIDDGRLASVVLGDGTKYDSMIRVRESALIKFWKNNERKAI